MVMIVTKDSPLISVDGVVKYGHKLLLLLTFMTFVCVAMSSLDSSTATTNNQHTDELDKHCQWKYYCLGMDERRRCTELSKAEIECSSGLGDHIIDVATRCPSGQAHDFRGKCRKIFV